MVVQKEAWTVELMVGLKVAKKADWLECKMGSLVVAKKVE